MHKFGIFVTNFVKTSARYLTICHGNITMCIYFYKLETNFINSNAHTFNDKSKLGMCIYLINLLDRALFVI